ncbi:c-type cytochrome [bacterium]|nr:c-type cytochrome [bacterium]MBU1984399.1 c-type cytochrome [bacterium]
MTGPHGTLPDHDYDGINEEDNPLPKWWLGIFYFAILFSIVYVPVVHVFKFLPQTQLDRSVAHAARVQELRELELEASGELDKDPVAAGKKYFKTFCVSCHGTYGEGGIGPNLHDEYWIHGAAEESIRGVITSGVAAKGMPAWGPILGDRKINNLAEYVVSMWDEKLPEGIAGKKPEGEKFDMAVMRAPKTETEEAAAPDSAVTGS